MLRIVQRLIPRHGIWLLIVLTLLAVAERRVAAYSHWPGAELSVEDANAMKGERIFQAALLAVDEAKPRSRAPPFMSEDQRTT